MHDHLTSLPSISGIGETSNFRQRWPGRRPWMNVDKGWESLSETCNTYSNYCEFQCWCITKCHSANCATDRPWFGSRRLTRVPLSTVRHKALRLTWGHQRFHWTVYERKHIPWSDKSRCQLYRVDGCVRLWRQPHESLHPSCQQRTIHIGASVVARSVCMCSWHDMEALICLKTNLTGDG